MSHREQPISQAEYAAADAIAAGEVVIGQVAGMSPTGKPLVDFAQNVSGQPLPAISTSPVNHEHSGRRVALMFVDGDIGKPLIVGIIHDPLRELIDGFELSAADDTNLAEAEAGQSQDLRVDGKRVVIEGEDEIVLKCGEASITLTRAGKILIRGKYLLNRSTGVNRILGGSVQVN